MDPGSKALNPMKNFDTLPDLGSVSTIQIITCRPHILLYIMIDWCLEKINVSQWEVGKLLNKIDVFRIWACFIKLPWKVLPGCLMCWITLCTWSWWNNLKANKGNTDGLASWSRRCEKPWNQVHFSTWARIFSVSFHLLARFAFKTKELLPAFATWWCLCQAEKYLSENRHYPHTFLYVSLKY